MHGARKEVLKVPNGHDYRKEYGGHSYPKEGITSMQECIHGCGCYVASFTSGGPLGLDPFDGECPNNPKDGKRLEGKADYEIVVTRRIRKGEEAEARLRRVTPTKKKLAQELDQAWSLLTEYRNWALRLKETVEREPKPPEA